MRTLKIVYLCFGLWFLTSAILGIRAIYSVHSQPVAPNQAAFRTVSSLFVSAFCVAAVYGIHKRSLVAWKLGWIVIAAGLTEFLVSALSAISKIPRNDHPVVAAAAVVVGGTAVALYWGFWWKRQKSYFVKLTPANNPRT
jgi:hypothetical protein